MTYEDIRNNYQLTKFVVNELMSLAGEEKVKELIEIYERAEAERSARVRKTMLEAGWREVARGVYSCSEEGI